MVPDWMLHSQNVRSGHQGRCGFRESLTLSTRNAEMPFGPAAPVRAMTKYTSEAPPPLMKALLPCTDLPFSLAALHSHAWHLLLCCQS